jgi:hypothetical protein
MGFAGARWTQKHHVVAGGNKIQGSQMGNDVTFESASMLEVELLQRFAGREPGGADTAFTAVRLTSRHLALQASHQVFLMAPVLGASPLSQPGHRLAQCWSFQRPRQISDLSGHIAALGDFGGNHHATPPSRSTPSAAS